MWMLMLLDKPRLAGVHHEQVFMTARTWPMDTSSACRGERLDG
jgi:hypothetical protein